MALCHYVSLWQVINGTIKPSVFFSESVLFYFHSKAVGRVANTNILQKPSLTLGFYYIDDLLHG